MSVEAAPIIVQPSGDFLGNDGSWSTFTISVGVPPQSVQVLASTETQENLIVLPSGCDAGAGDASNCTQLRGGVYNNTASSKWVSKNIYALGLETNLGLIRNSDNGQFGYDQFSLSTAQKGNVTLPEQIIAGIATKDFFLGTLGLSQAPVNFTDPFDSRPSLITNLKNQSLIPSLSYGYTAGASYRNNATASLTLGGYDASRFTPNDVSFNLAPDEGRQLVVALERISFSDSGSSDTPLLTDGILTLVDSTVPTIWLPLEACQAFERAFGISYNPIQNLYLVNNTLHEQMVKQNASVTFTLAQTIGSPTSINITLPYSSFDLQVDSPLVKSKQNYFPLRRAADNTQYTIGRTFLQEAYLIVDYGNKNFSISQTTFTNEPAHIIAIAESNGIAGSTSPTGNGGSTITKSTGHSSHSFPVGAIAGIVIAVIIIAFVTGFFTAKRWRKARPRRKSLMDDAELPADPRYPHGKAEVDGAHSSDNLPEKKSITINAYSVTPSPWPQGSELQDTSSYFLGSPMELPGSPPPPPTRSEAPSPEPSYRYSSRHSRAEMATPEPCAPELLTTEMPSPELNPSDTPVRGNSPSSDIPSALNSPSLPWRRPSLGTRRLAHDQVSRVSGTERPNHERQGSDDSISTAPFTPANPSHLHLRQDSNDSESMTTIHRNPSQRTDSDPAVSPIGGNSSGLTHRPVYARMNSSEAQAATFETRMEESAPSSAPSVGRRLSGRRTESGHLSEALGTQLGSMTEEELVEEPTEHEDPKPVNRKPLPQQVEAPKKQE